METNSSCGEVRALPLGSDESMGKQVLHCKVVEQNSTKHGQMPDVVATAHVVEQTWAPSFRDLRGIDAGSDEVDQDALHDGGIEIHAPGKPPSVCQLRQGRKSRQSKCDVESHTSPSQVGSIERRMPGEDHTANTKTHGEGNVGPSGHGFTVKRRVLRGHNGRSHQERDPGVVYTSEAFHERLVGNAVHSVPQGTADQALARSKEKDGGNDHVGVGAQVEVGVQGIEIEGH